MFDTCWDVVRFQISNIYRMCSTHIIVMRIRTYSRMKKNASGGGCSLLNQLLFSILYNTRLLFFCLSSDCTAAVSVCSPYYNSSPRLLKNQCAQNNKSPSLYLPDISRNLCDLNLVLSTDDSKSTCESCERSLPSTHCSEND